VAVSSGRVVVGDIEGFVDCVDGVFDGLAFAGKSGFGVGGDVVIGTVCMLADVRFLGLDRLRPNKSDKHKRNPRKNMGKTKKTV